ncbi:hypothetical protein TNCV_4382411 [Trichonephila clavipes]|nr:hypothetical protein TNCV_4382411 [Trichonephila clavipes]
MSKMEIKTPTSVIDCTERLRKCSEIEGYYIVANNYQGLDKLPDTAENQEMKEILRAAMEETLQKRLICNVRKEGVSFANIVSGVTSPSPTPSDNLNKKPSIIENNSKESQGILSEDDNTDDLAQVIELIITNYVLPLGAYFLQSSTEFTTPRCEVPVTSSPCWALWWVEDSQDE